MNTLYRGFMLLHVLGGALGLLTFWLPVLFRKGSTRHRQSGTWFVWGMTMAGLTGLVMTMWWMADPMLRIGRAPTPPADLDAAILRVRLLAAFLGLLSLMLLTNLRHGVLVLGARSERLALRKPTHLLLLSACGVAGASAIATGVIHHYVLLQVFGSVALLTAATNLRYTFKTQISDRQWWMEHLGNLFGAGIAAHTAFLVFGGSRFIGELFSGNWQLLPWLLPGAIGIPAIVLVRRHYQRKFNAPAAAYPPHAATAASG